MTDLAYQTLELLYHYQRLGIEQAIDFIKFNQYLVSHHSTSIEGSTLTYIETTVLLSEGLTPKGKPLVHSLMQKDHYQALIYTLSQAKKIPYMPDFIQKTNAQVMQSTGQIYNTALGEVDGTKRQYRKGSVYAGHNTFVNYAKINDLVKLLCNDINLGIKSQVSVIEQLTLSFEAHYRLINIHPFYDGNGRTSRLLMNAIQTYFELPLALVHAHDKVSYIEAILESRNSENTQPFIDFMFGQYNQHLSQIIENHN